MIRNAQYKFALLSLKYIPVFMFVSMWVHTILLVFGINLPIAESIMGCALVPSILILSLSNIFKFCYIHKTLTIYSFIVDICINYERYIGFGCLLNILRIITVITGTIIFILLIIKFKEFRTNCVKPNPNIFK